MRGRRGTMTTAAILALAWLFGPAAAEEQRQDLVIFDFEENAQDWEIPDWAKVKDDDVGKILSTSAEVASSGNASLQLLADFPGGQWTGAYVEHMVHVTDWSPFAGLSADVYLPASAPRGLRARIILTVGENWEWTEMNRALLLEPGSWTTIKANLKPGSLDWKYFPDDAFRKDIRKVGIRIESDKQPRYSGPVYIDHIRLSS